MNNTYRPPAIKHAALASVLAFLVLGTAFIIANTCAISPLCDWMSAQVNVDALEMEDLAITYDSRIFLRPLQVLFQAFLYLIPFFHTGNAAAVLLTLLFAALTAGLVLLAAQHAGFTPLTAWAFVAVYLTSPVILRAVLSASGVTIPLFFLALVFLHLRTWQANQFWLALVWIGLGAALAVLAQFSILFFLILPVLAALAIAYRRMPENVYYAENALWIMITPLLYVFLVRFFFGYILQGDPFAFYHLEDGFAADAVAKQALASPVLPRLADFFSGALTYIWLANPAFVILSALALILALLKRQVFPVVYLLVLWIPLLLLRSAGQSGFYDPSALLAGLLMLASLLLALAITGLSKKRWIPLLPSLLLLAAWNGLHWALIF